MKTVESLATNEDEDKPQDGIYSPAFDPDPSRFPESTYMLRKEFDKALQIHKRILNDKTLSEDVRAVHLRKSSMLIEAFSQEIAVRDAALDLPEESRASSAAAPAPAPNNSSRVTLSDEDAYLEYIAKAKAIQERIAAKEKAASTQSSSSITDEDWTSLGATFNRAASKPGAFQDIVNRLNEEPVLEQPAARRTTDVSADKRQWEGFLAGNHLQSAVPANPRVRERKSSPQHLRGNSPGKGARPPSPTEDMCLGPIQDGASASDPIQDRNVPAQESSSTVAEDLSKSDSESASVPEDFDESIFLENLDKLAASGDL
jgi:hypothetical protein